MLHLVLTSELNQPTEAWRSLHLLCPWFWLSSREKKYGTLFKQTVVEELLVSCTIFTPAGLDSSSVLSFHWLNLSSKKRTEIQGQPDLLTAVHQQMLLLNLPSPTRDLHLLDFHLSFKAALVDAEAVPTQQVWSQGKVFAHPVRLFLASSAQVWLP